MDCRTLVDAEALKARLGTAGLRVFDCRCSPTDPEAGTRAYREGHLPGARHADLDRVLSSPPGSTTGRHPLPDRGALAKWLAEEGVGADTCIVAYDDAGGAFAARLWWLARWLGHPAAAVLDGGLRAWKAAGGTLEQGEVGPPRPARFPVRGPLVETLEAAQVLEIVNGRRAGRLVDARASGRYRGEADPIDTVAGHIPGAANLPFAGNIGADGCFRSPAELRRRFAAVLERPGEAVHYCGSGVTACHNMLAMEQAGLAGSRLYPGSWSEWIRDPERPISRGDDNDDE